MSSFKEAFKNKAIGGIMDLMRVLPIKKNKIMFVSYFGEYYNDNPQMICNELLDVPGLDLVWALRDGVRHPAQVRTVSPDSIAYLYELATARVWVDNSRKREWIRKKKGQFYLQTWHGNIGNKKSEGDAGDKLPPEYVERAKKDAKYTDLMISGSDFFTKYIRSYYWYDGEILECGTPRLDIFYNNVDETRSRVRRELSLKDNEYVVLYAPTFRQDMKTDYYRIDFNRLYDLLRASGKESRFLFRLHPNLADRADLFEYNDRFINASKYPSVYELIIASDLIISDYSSLFMEAALINKDVVLYTPDLEEYEKERGTIWKTKDLPFPYAMNFEELCDLILNFDEEKYLSGLKAFYDKLGIKEKGNASKVLADRILSVINGNN